MVCSFCKPGTLNHADEKHERRETIQMKILRRAVAGSARAPFEAGGAHTPIRGEQCPHPIREGATLIDRQFPRVYAIREFRKVHEIRKLREVHVSKQFRCQQ